MALRDWQSALGQLVEARSSGRDTNALDARALDEDDRRWLREVVGTPGFALTAEVPRWWRHLRVQRSARLTLLALRGCSNEMLRDYLRDVPCFSLFFVAEGLAFLEYVVRTETLPHVRAVARLEHALWTLKLGVPGSDGASCIPFPCEPQALLGALLSGGALPEPQPHPYFVLVAPGVPGLWRPAPSEEARSFEVS